MSISTACADATVSATDQRAIIADNAALLAEIQAVKQSLTTEREAADKALAAAREVISADADIINTYKHANNLLAEAAGTKDKKHTAEIKTEKRKGWQRAMFALVLGGIIGAVAAH